MVKDRMKLGAEDYVGPRTLLRIRAGFTPHARIAKLVLRLIYEQRSCCDLAAPQKHANTRPDARTTKNRPELRFISGKTCANHTDRCRVPRFSKATEENHVIAFLNIISRAVCFETASTVCYSFSVVLLDSTFEDRQGGNQVAYRAAVCLLEIFGVKSTAHARNSLRRRTSRHADTRV